MTADFVTQCNTSRLECYNTALYLVLHSEGFVKNEYRFIIMEVGVTIKNVFGF